VGIFLEECLIKIIKAMSIPSPKERIRPLKIIKTFEAKEQEIKKSHFHNLITKDEIN